MTMFDTYDNLSDNYRPGNFNPVCPKPNNPCLKPLKPTRPYEEYNALGELVGYWWNWGDTINLDFNITGTIVVEDNALIYSAVGECPSPITIGEIGQKAYNVVDLKSWTCTAIDDTQETIAFIWTLDEEFDNPEEGDRNIYTTVAEFMADKYVSVQIFNFRMEQIAIKTFNGAQQIVFPIDKELSEKMVKGIYYCRLTVWSGTDLSRTIFQEENCTLTVK